MARTTIDKATLKRYISAGLTQAQMVDEFYKETGERRARASFSLAMSRYGLEPARSTPRYADTVPWKGIPGGHYNYDHRMLRALGSREAGAPNQDALDGRLDAWLAEMDRDNLVIMYVPEHGFFRVPREEGDVGYITVKNVDKSLLVSD